METIALHWWSNTNQIILKNKYFPLKELNLSKIVYMYVKCSQFS
jgi:hypothetical protein